MHAVADGLMDSATNSPIIKLKFIA